jgi:tetratricopeptide (TPR) repeat protein
LYRRALSADPAYALAQIRLGRVEFLFKNMKAAAASLQKGSAAAEDPSHRYLAAMFMGAFLQEQRDLPGARVQFERALELAPRSQNAIVALAYVELISGRPDRRRRWREGTSGRRTRTTPGGPSRTARSIMQASDGFDSESANETPADCRCPD